MLRKGKTNNESQSSFSNNLEREMNQSSISKRSFFQDKGKNNYSMSESGKTDQSFDLFAVYNPTMETIKGGKFDYQDDSKR
jgi:hypothetical protein